MFALSALLFFNLCWTRGPALDGFTGDPMEFSTDGLEDFVTDPAAEVHGVEYRINEQVSFFIRRAGGRNKEYERCLSRLSRPYIRRLRNNQMSNEEFTNLVVLPTVIETVVGGWKGVKDKEGEEIPFSKDACRQLFDTMPNLFEEILAVATDMSQFKEQEKQEAAESLGEF